jgi:hypothetical protein
MQFSTLYFPPRDSGTILSRSTSSEQSPMPRSAWKEDEFVLRLGVSRDPVVGARLHDAGEDAAYRPVKGELIERHRDPDSEPATVPYER